MSIASSEEFFAQLKEHINIDNSMVVHHRTLHGHTHIVEIFQGKISFYFSTCDDQFFWRCKHIDGSYPIMSGQYEESVQAIAAWHKNWCLFRIEDLLRFIPKNERPSKKWADQFGFREWYFEEEDDAWKDI